MASAGIFCLVIFENRAHSGLDGGAASWGFLIAGQVLLALSSYVRYAGYFFIAGSGLYLAGAFLMRRTVQAFAAFASCLIAGGLVMPLLLRNIRLAGSWRGNSEVGTAGWDMILRRTVTVVKHLLYGSSREAQAGLWGIITIVSLSVILILVLGSLKAIDLRLILNGPQMGITLAAAALGGYTALMIYAGGQTGISKDPRMFLPVVPLLALCAGSTISWLRSGLAIRAARGGRLLVSAVIANMVAYAALNGEDVVSSRPYVPHRPVAQAFCEADYTGTALSSWVDSHISPDAVLLAACGQQTGYVLKRRTISFFNSGFSERDCEEKAVRETMNQYRADYLILYPGVQSSCGIQRECRFLSSLIENRTPDWLEVANSNGKVTIFRRKNKPARNAGDGTHSSPLGQSGTVRDGSKPRE
ncbi:MAG: hypothetical protein LLG20_13945 [Acidobacteriales bacterium]|nr:hypothetical protein [Terriglobales bacterium]